MVKVGGGEPAVGLCDAFCGFFVGGDGFQGIDLVLGEGLVVGSMAHAIPQGRTIDVRPNQPGELRHMAIRICVFGRRCGVLCLEFVGRLQGNRVPLGSGCTDPRKTLTRAANLCAVIRLPVRTTADSMSDDHYPRKGDVIGALALFLFRIAVGYRRAERSIQRLSTPSCGGRDRGVTYCRLGHEGRLRRPSGRRPAVCGAGAVAGPDGQGAKKARSYACDVDGDLVSVDGGGLGSAA